MVTMKNIKYFVFAFILFICFLFSNLLDINAQQASSQSMEPGVQEGELLADIIISKFEDAESWTGQMPLDQGNIFLMKRYGKPNALPQVDPTTGIENKYVLGIKVMFNKRGFNRFIVRPPRPIKVPGITKSLSIWVAGRNFSHTLIFVVRDYYNQDKLLKVGTLNFLGWKKLTFVIPPMLVQDEYHYTELEGITFMGLAIETSPEESYGTFYVYFDELTAKTNIFNMSTQDKDDMIDNW